MEVQGLRFSDEPTDSSSVGRRNACTVIGLERFEAAERHHGVHWPST